MAKFHINQSSGNIGPCHAEKGNCPFGGEENHYTSMVAAATAYEKSMEAQAHSTTKKPRVKREPLESVRLSSSRAYFGETTTFPWEGNDLKDFSKEEFNLYSMLRKEAGPALIHSEAKSMVESWRLTRNNPGMMQFDEIKSRAGDHDLHEKLTDALNLDPKSYGTYKHEKELQNELLSEMRNSVLASRPYGFPEDEQSRYYMDTKEAELRDAVSRLSGVDADELRARVLESYTVTRPQESESESALLKRKAHLEKLSRLTNEKKRELKQIDRELGIRELLAKGDTVEGYEKGYEFISSGVLSAKEVCGLIGTPREANKLPASLKKRYQSARAFA